MRLPPTAQLIATGLLSLIAGALLGSGCTAPRRYPAEDYQRQVDRADLAERKAVKLTENENEAKRQAAVAKFDLEKLRKQLAELKTANGAPEWATPEASANAKGEVEAVKRQTAAAKQLAASREDQHWAVISEDYSGVLRVRLSRKATDGVLRSIAVSLRGERPPHSGQHVVIFFLPCMNEGIDTNGWARATFDSEKDDEWQIRVFGLSIKREIELIAASQASLREAIVGIWVDEGVKRLLIIYRKGNTLCCQRRFEDGSGGETELVEASNDGIKRFDYRMPAPGQEPGGYLLVNSAGNLEEWVPSKPENRADLVKLGFRFDGDHGLLMTARAVLPIGSGTSAP